jgi:hypothetical protein
MDGKAKFDTVVNKQYMIVDKWALNNLYTRWKQRRRTAHFFDLGASTYLTGLGGASQPWFVGLGDCMCVPYSSMHLWEATQHAPKTVWHQLPRNLHPHYHWYNYPLSVDAYSWRNPLNHVLEKVELGDPFVLKVDFDNTPLETKIIQTILQTPQLSELIDEMFFEHHAKIAVMMRFWGELRNSNVTLMDSIEMFTQLRQRGIRAHPWV